MATRLATLTRNAMANAVRDRVDLGSAAGKLRIYSGTQPASANDAPTGTLLAEVVLGDPSFAAAANGSSALADPPAVNGVAAGSAAWGRFVDSDNNAVFDVAITATGGGGEVTLSNTSIAVGQSVDITGGTITMPAA